MNSEKNNGPRAKQTGTDAMNDFRLGAARRRLAESSGQKDAIEALREIVGNFLGSEELSLFQVDHRTAEIRILWSFGIDPETCCLLRALGDVGLERMVRGECHVEFPPGGGAGTAPRTKAFVPIRLANHTVAVLAILRLLPQKLGFDKPDMDLLTLLSHEAGQALFGSTLKTATEKPEMRA